MADYTDYAQGQPIFEPLPTSTSLHTGIRIPLFRKGRSKPSLSSAADMNLLVRILQAFVDIEFISPSGSIYGELTLDDNGATISLDTVAPPGGGSNKPPPASGTMTPMLITAVNGDYWSAAEFTFNAATGYTLGATHNVAKPQDLRNSVLYRNFPTFDINGLNTGWVPTKATFVSPLVASFVPFTTAYPELMVVSPEVNPFSSIAITQTTAGSKVIDIGQASAWAVGQIVAMYGSGGFPNGTTDYITNLGSPNNMVVTIGQFNATTNSSGGTMQTGVPSIIFAMQTGGKTGVKVGGVDVDWQDLNVDNRQWGEIPLTPGP